MYKVLIVEDEDIIRKGLLYTIPWGELECSIVGEARNGVEGEEAIRALSPDIVIADITMPIKDGLEMIRDTVREFDYAAIILSGYSEFEYARTAIQYGVAAYLLKPLNMTELKETILSAGKKIDEKRSYRLQKERVRSMLDTEILPEVNAKNSGDVIAAAMLDYVKEHYSEKILMSDVERNCNYSGVVLNRRFKAQMGITFNEYLNRYRIRKAVEMLNEGSSVHEAAASCGFSEYKYFNTVFRKYVGYSPKDFLTMLQSARL
jgi:two-component system response regulator YesN